MNTIDDVIIEDEFKEPDWLEPNFDNIPDELKAQPWGVWKAEPRLDKDKKHTGKWNKAPRNPLTGQKVGANQPKKFGTLAEAMKAYKEKNYSGVGVLLTGNGITGIDIDDAAEVFRKRPEVEEWVKKAVNDGAHCEISPSSSGVRLFIAGNLEGGGKKKNCLEVYDDGRFLTVTGHTIGGKEDK